MKQSRGCSRKLNGRALLEARQWTAVFQRCFDSKRGECALFPSQMTLIIHKAVLVPWDGFITRMLRCLNDVTSAEPEAYLLVVELGNGVIASQGCR